MPKETKSRVTAAQIDVLCTFFEENPEVIRGYKKTPKCIEAVQTKWKKITPHLNSLGPTRDHKAWAKYLCDMKAKLKRKRIKWRQNSDGTGPIICNADDFNEIGLRMLQVLRKDTSNLQDSQDSNTSDLETEDNTNDDIDHGNYDIPEILLKETNNKTKSVTPPYNKLLLNDIAPEPHAPQVFVSQNEYSDEFDTFGKNIAQQLRTLPLPVALETQEILLSVMRNQRLKVLNDTYGNNNSDPFFK